MEHRASRSKAPPRRTGTGSGEACAPSRADPPRRPLRGTADTRRSRRCHEPPWSSPGPVPEPGSGCGCRFPQSCASRSNRPTDRSSAAPVGTCTASAEDATGGFDTTNRGRGHRRVAKRPCPGRVWRRTGTGRPRGVGPDGRQWPDEDHPRRRELRPWSGRPEPRECSRGLAAKARGGADHVGQPRPHARRAT